jgi:hypothetical protein
MYALLQHCCAAALVVALPSAEAQLGTTDHRAAASSLAAPSSAYAVSVRSVPSCWLCCCCALAAGPAPGGTAHSTPGPLCVLCVLCGCVLRAVCAVLAWLWWAWPAGRPWPWVNIISTKFY